MKHLLLAWSCPIALVWRVLAGIAAALALPAVAQVPLLCVPHASGVPYWNGGPNWWGSDPDPQKQRLATGFDDQARRTIDPRWRGAASIGYDQGAGEIGEFRALHQNGQLLFAWSSKSLPQFNKGMTSLVVGLQMGSGTPTFTRLKINATSTRTTATGPAVMVDAQVVVPGDPAGTTYLGFDKRYFVNSAWTNTAPANVPALENIKLWVANPTSSATTTTAWTIQMSVPTGGATGFKLWYSMQSSVPINGSNGLPSFTWPRGPALTWTYYDVLGGASNIPAPSTWGDFNIGPSPNCKGVSMTDIAVTNPEFPGQTGRFSLWVQNIASAKAQNLTAGTLDMSKLKATWYGAAWGSQSFDLTGGSWAKLTPILVDVDNSSATSIAVSAKAEISKPWSLTRPDRCEFRGKVNPNAYLADEEHPSTAPNCTGTPAPTKHPHSCTMVKLDGPFEFLNDSALVNMDFGRASVLQRDAEVSALALPRSRAGQRDIFLFEDRRNMPAYSPVLRRGQVVAELLKISREVQEINALVLRGEKAGPVKTAAALRMLAANPEFSKRMVERYQGLKEALERQQREDAYQGVNLSLHETLAAALPTIAWHGFHDTGELVYIDGVPHRLLGQQSSFGLYMLHDQPYYGWVQQASSNAKRSAPGVIKLSVPDGRRARMRLSVEAVEKIRPLKDYRDLRLPLEEGWPRRVKDPEPMIR